MEKITQPTTSLEKGKNNGRKAIIALAITLMAGSMAMGQMPMPMVTIGSGSNAETSTISSLKTSQTNRVLVFDFELDNVNTGLTGASDFTFETLNVTVASVSSINWASTLAGARLSDGTNNVVSDRRSSSEISFGFNSGSRIPTGAGKLGHVDDGTTKNYSIEVWFDAGSNNNLDGKNLVLSINSGSFQGRNGPALSSNASSGSTNNKIEVIATQYRFNRQPSTTNAYDVMSPSVRIHATDINGKRDRDHTSTPQVRSTGTMIGNPFVLTTASWTNGLSTLPDVVHTVEGSNLELKIEMGAFGDATSSSFNITDNTNPTMQSAVDNSNTQIDVTFSELVQNNGAAAGDFKVTDGSGTDFPVTSFTVLTPAANAVNGIVRLTVDNFSTALGDLTLTYIKSSGSIDDLSSNSLADNTTGFLVIDDATPPTISVSGASVNANGDRIILVFSEPVQRNIMNPGSFIVTDGGGINTSVSVTGIEDNVMNDDTLKLAVNLSLAVRPLTFTYTGSVIEDFGGNSLQNISTPMSITDNTPPVILNTNVPMGSITQINLHFSEPVQINGAVPGDFTVRDGLNNNFAVSGIAATSLSNVLQLTVADFGMAVGDLTITYNVGSGTIDDLVTPTPHTLMDTSVHVDFDMTPPFMQGFTFPTSTSINIVFNEPVQISSTNAGDFTVTDGLPVSPSTFTVTDIKDATIEDDTLELTVNDFSAAVGDLIVTYNKTTSSIDDFGGNSLPDGMTTANYDTTNPIMTSANVPSGSTTEINVVFDEPVQIVGDPSARFEVVDGLDSTFAVTMVDDGTAEDNTLVLTVDDFSAAAGDLKVTHTIPPPPPPPPPPPTPSSMTDVVRDFGANDVDMTVSVDINYDTTDPEIDSLRRWNPMSPGANGGSDLDPITNLPTNRMVTFRVKFTEPVQDVDIGDFMIQSGGASGTLSASALTEVMGTAVAHTVYEIVVTNVAEAGTNILNLNPSGAFSIRDYGGNTNDNTITINNEEEYEIDQSPVTANVNDISITSTPTGTASTYKIGDNITARWDNSTSAMPPGPDASIDSVFFIFTEFGGDTIPATNVLNAMMVETNMWEATYTIVAAGAMIGDTIDINDAHVFLRVVDIGGNVTVVEHDTDIMIDNEPPVVTAGAVIIAGNMNLGLGGVYNADSEITVGWNNTGGTVGSYGTFFDDNPDIDSVEFDFANWGGVTETVNQSNTTPWIRTYMFSSGSIDASGLRATITAIDDAGNESMVETPAISVDNIIPTVTAVNITISGHTGNSNAYIIGDQVDVMWDNTPTPSGDGNTSTELRSSSPVIVDFSEFGGPTMTAATESPTNTWTASYTIVEGMGMNLINGDTDRNVSIIVTDNAGNALSVEDNENVTVDNVRPTPTGGLVAPDLIASSDLGSSNTDDISSLLTPTFVGAANTAVAGTDLFLYSDQHLNTVIASATSAMGGSWSVTVGTGASSSFSGLQQNVTHQITYTTTDAAGNESVRSTKLDYQHVSPPTFTMARWLDSDSDGDIDQLEITFDKNVAFDDQESGDPFTALTFPCITPCPSSPPPPSPTFAGQLTSSNLQTVTLNLNPITGTAPPPHSVQYNPSPPSPSSIASNVGGIEVDVISRITPADAARPVVINSISLDSGTPDGNTDVFELELSEPIMDISSAGSDFQVTSPAGGPEALGMFSTNVSSLTMGSTSDDEYITLSFPATRSLPTATGTGAFKLTYNAPASSPIVDAAGNVLNISNGDIVDGAAPRAIALTPPDNTGTVSPTNTLTLTYSEDVIGVSGKEITVARSIPPNNDVLDATMSSEVTISGNVVTLNLPSGSIIGGTNYFVYMEDGTFRDAANNPSADQFDDNMDWNFTTINTLTVSSTSVNGTTGIDLLLNYPITSISPTVLGDFTVMDGIKLLPVTALTPSGNTLSLAVNLSTAVGDLTIAFDGVGMGGSGTTNVDSSSGSLVDFTGLNVDFDSSNPTINSFVVNSDTEIELIFSEPVQILPGSSFADFTVKDGFDTDYPVTGLSDDATPNDNVLLLTCSGGGLSMPVGDIQIDYTGSGDVADFGGNELLSQSITLDSDAIVPTLDSIVEDGPTGLKLVFSEPVQLIERAPATDFSLEDGAGRSVIVTTINDAVLKDDTIELITQDRDAFLGDFTLTYTSTETVISDFGGNKLGNFSNSLIDSDVTPPGLSSAAKISDTQIAITFDEAIEVSGAIADFTFRDQAGNPLMPSSFDDVNLLDETFEVTFIGGLNSAIGDIEVAYARTTAGVITDFGGNDAATQLLTPPILLSPMDTVIIDLELTVAPVIQERGDAAMDALSSSAVNNDALALYRSITDLTDTIPISITPAIDGSTISIYLDSDLNNLIGGINDVSGNYDFPMSSFFKFTSPETWTSGTDRSGIFTFYIVEVNDGGNETSTSPASVYSIAVLDQVTNSAGIRDFSESDDVGTNISFSTSTTLIDAPWSLGGQTYTISGDGLAKINNATGFAQFIPSAAAQNTQISIQMQNAAGMSATFDLSELNFRVTSISNVFADNNKNIHFGKTAGLVSLDINGSLTNVDPTELPPIDGPNPDFHNIEVFHLVQGTLFTPTPVTPPALSAIDILIYDSDRSDGGNNRPPIDMRSSDPTFVVGEWEMNLSALPNFTTLSSDAVDTLVFETYSKEDGGGTALTRIGSQEVYLYPDPDIAFSNLSSFYCEDETGFDIQVDIFTYANTAYTSGGVDLTDQTITNGYKLYYNPSIDFSVDPGNYMLIADSTATGSLGAVNTFDPSMIKNISNAAAGKVLGTGAGWYQIEYTSLPQTNANLTTTITEEFYIVPIRTAPVLDVASVSNAQFAGGDGSKYVIEYCSGDIIDDLSIDAADLNSRADAGNTAYNWYRSNGSLITTGVVLSPTDYLTSNQLFGNQLIDLTVTRVLDACESDPVPINIRIYDEPESPMVNTTDTNNHPRFDGSGFYTNINSASDEYYFEYCALVSDDIVSFDLLTINSNLNDPLSRSSVQDRSYFAVYRDAAGTDLIDILSYNTTSDYSFDFVNGLSESVANNVPSDTPNDPVVSEIWIQKVVADTTIYGSSPLYDGGCRTPDNELTKVTIAIYTYPEIPSNFAGEPRFDTDTSPEVVNYYTCQGDFPEIGVNPPDVSSNETEFEWFADVGLTDKITTGNRRGEVVTQMDLVDHAATSAANDFDPDTPGVYTFYVRLLTNINTDSDFVGCESPARQVNLIVYPSSDGARPLTVTEGVAGELLNTMNTNIGNFDIEYNFCVSGGVGLSPLTAINSDVQYTGAPTVTGTGTPAEQNELLWFMANETGDAIINSNPLTAVESATSSYTATATDLQISGTENANFNFAVVHRADFISGYTGFDGCFSDTTFVRVVVRTTPEPQFRFSGITVGEGLTGEGTVFDFVDETSKGVAVDYEFNIHKVVNGTTSGSPETSNSGNADLELSDQEFKYKFTDPGIYEGILTIRTAAGCNINTKRRFQILDKIEVTDSYAENFEATDGGWFAEFQSDDGLIGSIDEVERISSWAWETPNGNGRIIGTRTSPTGKAWATTGNVKGSSAADMNEDNYVGGEVSYVYSPAFDISQLDNPAIRFNTSRDLDGTKDGVVFQYSVDDGGTWETLGDFNRNNQGLQSSGQNWYNESQISTSPGSRGINSIISSSFNSRGVGWSGQYTSEELVDDGLINFWFESTHELSEIPIDPNNEGVNQRSNVRFRFALSSIGIITDVKSGDGFAFDDMQIFQIGKTILLEQFSSAVDAKSISIGEQVNNLANSVLMINYFTDIENSETSIDPLNLRYPTGPGARSATYGVGIVPITVLDGNVIAPRRNGQGTIIDPGWDENDLAIAGLTPALFDMPLGNKSNEFGVRQDPSDPGRIAVTAEFDFTLSDTTLVDQDYSFLFAVVELEIDGSLIGNYSDGDVVRNVLRVLLPTPAGFNYRGDVTGATLTNEAQKFEYSVEWDINNVYDASKLRVIAFAQDNNTKNVLQAGWVDIQGASETILGIEGVSGFTIYPNPANGEVLVEFKELANIDADWVLLDQLGRDIFKGSWPEGSKSIKLDTSQIPSGLYFFQLYKGDQRERARRIMITHK